MRKAKVAISLSAHSIAIMEALRERTDASSDSEVFRNSLRLHLALVRAAKAGARLYLRGANGEALVPVDMFAGLPSPEK